MPRKITTQIFISEARTVHGNKYDYSKAVYKKGHQKIIIICPEHGEFWQEANSHKQGHGCKICGVKQQADAKRDAIEDFISAAMATHGDRYNYDEVRYHNQNTKVTIVCNKHGKFGQRPAGHIGGDGCPKCRGESLSIRFRKGTDAFLKDASCVHGKRYDYDRARYTGHRAKVTIICRKHGEFRQRASDHLSGNGCPTCGDEAVAAACSKDTEYFLAKAKEAHGTKYDYSQVEYEATRLKVVIICSEHGPFRQTPNKHLAGQGCPHCNQVSSGEDRIERALDEWGISYEKQKRFKNCRRKFPLPFDFYFKMNGQTVLVEYDGRQHFEPVDYWGGEKEFQDTQKRDRIKTEFAKRQGYHLIRVPYTVKQPGRYLRRELETVLGLTQLNFEAPI